MTDRRHLKLVESTQNYANSVDARLKGNGGDGTFDGMEARVKRLEDDGKELRQDLKTIMRDLSEIKGRVNAMPTTWQMVSFVVALALAIFTIVRIALPV